MLKQILTGCIFYSFMGFSQENEVSTLDSNFLFNKVSLRDFGYYGNTIQEQHSNFRLDWSLNQKNSLLIIGNYDTNATGDLFKSQLLFKRNLSPNLYLFSGVEMNTERNLLGNNINSNSSYQIINGIGYQSKQKLFIELFNEIRVGNTNLITDDRGNYIKIRSLYKF